jgi:hypothetical protein
MPDDHIDDVAAVAAAFLRLMTPAICTVEQARAVSSLAAPILSALCQVFNTDPAAIRARAESLLPTVNAALRPTVH